MKISKCIITAAAASQRTLPLQQLVDRDGVQKPVLSLLVNEAMQAGAQDVCIVVHPGDEESYREAADPPHLGQVHFVAQNEPRGYGHALWCAREFIGAGEGFLHLVGDHIFLSDSPTGEHAAQLISRIAREADCSVSGVQPTRESLLPYFGTIGGQRIKGTQDRYAVERVIEKPTPTEAEQSLTVPGYRAGYYPCFMGTHAFTPLVMEILDRHVSEAPAVGANIQLSPALDELAHREQFLALETPGRRFPLDTRYGLLMAQLALALSGTDRDEVLVGLCDLLAQREIAIK